MKLKNPTWASCEHMFVSIGDNHRNSNTALLRLLIDEDSAVVVLLLVGEHVDVQQRLLRAQAVARARWPSGKKISSGSGFESREILTFKKEEFWSFLAPHL